MAKYLAAGALALAPAALSLLISAPAKAACLSTTAETPIPNNNCLTYDTTSSPTKAVLYYQDVNLTNPYWQLTGSMSTISNFSNWEYGSNGTSWTAFNPGFTAVGAVATGQIFDSTTTPSAPAGSPFYIRVTLSNTATLSSSYQFALRTNNDKAVDGSGRLDDTGSNLASNLTRNFTRLPDPTPPSSVPGPLPLFGAAAAFGYSRKLRKAIRATAV